jgi:hypothetical protein
MTTLPPEPSRVTNGARVIQPPKTAKEADSKRRGRKKASAVSWYGRLLIIATLLIAAGLELFQWVLMIITQD